MKFNLIAIAGWIYLIILPFGIIKYIKTGTVYTKWATYSGDSARDALIGYILLAIFLGSYSISETIKFYRKWKNQKDFSTIRTDNHDKNKM